MMNPKSLAAQLLVLAACCVLPGCSHSDRPATFPVHGKVTYQGRPVAGATVAFLAPGAPRSAVGTTDQEGSFRLTTFETDDGAIAGTHVITVIKTNGQPIVATAEAGQVENDPAAIEKAMQQTALQMRRAQSSVPARYADRKTSNLRQEVAPRENEVEIKLID